MKSEGQCNPSGNRTTNCGPCNSKNYLRYLYLDKRASNSLDRAQNSQASEFW